MASDWQPIETAPRDGTYIDLWIKHSPGGNDCRATDCTSWEGAWCQFEDGYPVRVECVIGRRDGRWWKATHWMSLPTSPTTEDSKTNG